MRGAAGEMIVMVPGWSFRLLTVITLTAGTAFIMWLGEQITERGIGNGISLIIFAGIVARMPNAVASTLELFRVGQLSIITILVIVVLMVLVVAVIIFVETGQRRLPVQYAKRIVGRRVYGGQSTHLPLKLNTSGVIPPIFASSILMFPVDDRQLRAQALAGCPSLGSIASDQLGPGGASIQFSLCGIYHLLLLFLYGGDVQSR